MMSWNEKREAIQRELDQQNEAFERARRGLAALGDVHLAVAPDALEALEVTTTSNLPAGPIAGVRA